MDDPAEMGTLEATVEWDTGFIHDPTDMTETYKRRGVVSLSDGQSFPLILHAQHEYLSDAVDADQLERDCVDAVAFAVERFYQNPPPEEGQAFHLRLPVSKPMQDVTELLRSMSSASEKGRRFRYSAYLYYREEDGKPKLARTCQGSGEGTGKPACNDYDVYINMSSPEMLGYQNAVAELCASLAAVGLATDLVRNVKAAINRLDHSFPCTKGPENETGKAPVRASSKKHVH